VQKKVLFISYDGMTDPLGQSQVLPYLQGLSKSGYQIFLLSCEKEQVFIQNKAIIDALVATANITWVPLTYTKNPPVLSTLLDIIKMRNAAKKLHLQHGIDMVHTRPGVPALVGLWLKKKFGIKFLNDIREFYADSRVEGLMWRLENPLYKMVYRFFKRKETEAVALNDGIVCLTYAAEKIIQQWPEFKKGTPLEVIPCSADLELFNPASVTAAQTTALKNELHITPNDFIVTYLGSIGGWYLTNEMLDFCKVLNDKMPAAKFLFISPHRHEEIIAAAVKHQLPAEKIITKKATRKEVPLLLSLSNFSIFFIRPCYSKQSSSPTKHGEIMAMGIPLITNSGVGDVQAIVEKYKSGIVINNFTNEDYITAAMAIGAKQEYNAAAIRKGAEEFYSLQSAIEKYKRIYGNILQ
jgi:glycosyltransferase involved in cell wall biosynthesis